MTIRYARILAGLMPEAACDMLRNFGKADMSDIPESAVDYLRSFKLITEADNLLNGQKVWVLTADGKKVQKCLDSKS